MVWALGRWVSREQTQGLESKAISLSSASSGINLLKPKPAEIGQLGEAAGKLKDSLDHGIEVESPADDGMASPSAH